MKRITAYPNLIVFLFVAIFSFSACSSNDDSQEQSLRASSTALTFTAIGSIAQTVKVTAVGISSWTYSTEDDWISVSKADDILAFSVTDNTGQLERVGYIYVTASDFGDNVRITVTQRADKDSRQELSVSPAELSFAADATDPQVVTATNIKAWSAATTDAWIHLKESDGQLTVSVDANTATEARNGNVTITATGYPGTASITVSQREKINEDTGKPDLRAYYTATSASVIGFGTNSPSSFVGWIQTVKKNYELEDGHTYDLHFMANFVNGVDEKGESLVAILATNEEGVSSICSSLYSSKISLYDKNGALLEEGLPVLTIHTSSEKQILPNQTIAWDPISRTFDLTRTVDGVDYGVMLIAHSSTHGYIAVTDAYIGLKITVGENESTTRSMSYAKKIEMNGKILKSFQMPTALTQIRDGLLSGTK